MIDLVLNQGLGLTKMSKKLNIKLSTAKLILRKFRRTGQLNIRITKKMILESKSSLGNNIHHPKINNLEEIEQNPICEVIIPEVIQQSINVWPFSYIGYSPCWQIDYKYYY